MDGENTNHADYVHDLDLLDNLLNVLLKLQDILEENPVAYPLAIKAYNTVLFGLIPVISCECPHCGKDIKINAGTPCGGIDDAYDVLEAAIEALDLEVKFERSDSDDYLPEAPAEG